MFKAQTGADKPDAEALIQPPTMQNTQQKNRTPVVGTKRYRGLCDSETLHLVYRQNWPTGGNGGQRGLPSTGSNLSSDSRQTYQQ